MESVDFILDIFLSIWNNVLKLPAGTLIPGLQFKRGLREERLSHLKYAGHARGFLINISRGVKHRGERLLEIY